MTKVANVILYMLHKQVKHLNDKKVAIMLFLIDFNNFIDLIYPSNYNSVLYLINHCFIYIIIIYFIIINFKQHYHI